MSVLCVVCFLNVSCVYGFSLVKGEFLSLLGQTIKFMCLSIRFASEQHRMYVHVPIRMTWDDALKYCRAKHTDLAVFRTKSEYEALEDTCGLDKRCWIGLHRDDTNAAVWNWANGEEVSFTSWATNEPNHEREECAVMINKGWFDISCSYTYEKFKKNAKFKS
uniref:C-type lectin domain-containing protein n=1 Tax=Labrus bergylta TaxID=56723 RepID=A0A3Q3G872_9LABR